MQEGFVHWWNFSWTHHSKQKGLQIISLSKFKEVQLQKVQVIQHKPVRAFSQSCKCGHKIGVSHPGLHRVPSIDQSWLGSWWNAHKTHENESSICPNSHWELQLWASAEPSNVVCNNELHSEPDFLCLLVLVLFPTHTFFVQYLWRWKTKLFSHFAWSKIKSSLHDWYPSFYHWVISSQAFFGFCLICCTHIFPCYIKWNFKILTTSIHFIPNHVNIFLLLTYSIQVLYTFLKDESTISR
jgi:hypothetical protein